MNEVFSPRVIESHKWSISPQFVSAFLSVVPQFNETRIVCCWVHSCIEFTYLLGIYLFIQFHFVKLFYVFFFFFLNKVFQSK